MLDRSINIIVLSRKLLLKLLFLTYIIPCLPTWQQCDSPSHNHNFPKVNNNPKDLSQAAPAPKPVWELLRKK